MGCYRFPEDGLLLITPLDVNLIGAVEQLVGLGDPWLLPRTSSDYWLYATLFSSTCPVALINGHPAASIIAFRSQDLPDEVYVQDVITHPDHRRQGLTRSLMQHVSCQAQEWQCRRVFLTSEPHNTGAHATWLRLGFTNVPGDYQIAGISVTAGYKGPGKDRAVYELTLP